MKNPINLNELKQFVIDNPGTSISAMRMKFNCDQSKVMRGMKPLREEGFLFRQVNKGNVIYFEAGYARKHRLKKSILATPKSSAWYRAFHREQDRQTKSFVELQRLLHKLWPVMRSSR